MLEDIGSICQYFRGVVTGKDANGLQDSRILVTYNFEYKGDFQEAVEELVGHLTEYAARARL